MKHVIVAIGIFYTCVVVIGYAVWMYKKSKENKG